VIRQRARDTQNLFALFEARSRQQPKHVATRSRRGGSWEWTTWEDWFDAAKAICAALIERGVSLGDRVAIMSTSREEWTVIDLGALGAAAASVPIYPTATSEQVGFILSDSDATLAFVEGRRELEAVKGAAEAASSLQEIVVIGAAGVDLTRVIRTDGTSVRVTSYLEVVRTGRDRVERAGGHALVRDRAASVCPEALATIAYTSGTTGTPRGVLLSHSNFAFELDAILEAVSIGPDDEQLLVLPLAHILGRVMLFGAVLSGSRLAFGEGPHRFVENVGDVQPTFFAAVPRLFEKVYAVTNDSARGEGPLKSALFSWAIGVGRQESRALQKGKRLRGVSAARARYADALVLRRLRKVFGERLRFAISGGAPLSRELAEWFHACGILILEGYGLTECTGASHVNRENRFAFGSVGPPIAGVEARIGTDGEVLLRGPTVTRGLWNAPPGTDGPIDRDGWLHTGDIGRLDGDVLTIVDRKKDLIVTAGGSNVAPQGIENMLAASPWISHAVVYGDRRPYLVALLTLDAVACKRWARERKRKDDLASLANDPELLALIQLDVDAVNRRLSSYETIKRFAAVDRDLTVDTGELTDTLKVRRKVVHQKYRALFESLY
jgi:long-chain acyl-CoA synthetase